MPTSERTSSIPRDCAMLYAPTNNTNPMVYSKITYFVPLGSAVPDWLRYKPKANTNIASEIERSIWGAEAVMTDLILGQPHLLASGYLEPPLTHRRISSPIAGIEHNQDGEYQAEDKRRLY
ncbi:hypothetical protein BTUL_0073g00220 [Botrytis tulipae]|uniref:Uncharacterized protein n=1 Tax=Botrytis tulipae TaxID=87230 RepID=A0A4Z1ELE8_9HELO|nr:hypothetical protein BTUL_0073g00220 [Botrytis tulipae]